jgi:hypothetical protein
MSAFASARINTERNCWTLFAVFAFTLSRGAMLFAAPTDETQPILPPGMTMVDLTGIEAKEGDEVIVFGKELPIQEVAARINTIPYEILTSTSDRVKRVFFAESI